MSATSAASAASYSRRCGRSGPEGIVSKRRGAKCRAVGTFMINGFSELGAGRLEAIYVAEVLAGELRPVGQVRFGFAGKGLWPALDERRAGPTRRGGFIPVRLGSMVFCQA